MPAQIHYLNGTTERQAFIKKILPVKAGRMYSLVFEFYSANPRDTWKP